MKDCDRWHQSIARRLAGEAGAAELASLAEHCLSCPDCRSLCAIDEDLRGASAAVQPDAAGLAEVRRAVMRQARSEAQRDAGAAWLPRLLSSAGSAPPRAISPRALAAVITAAAALVAAGFLLGRGGVQPPGAAPDAVAREVGRAALAGDARRDPLDSPFIYSNVRLEDGTGGRLHLGFDVSAHLELDRSAGDPVVAEVVAQALLAGTSPVGSRLKAVAVAARLPDPRVRGALLRALRDDPSPAVRLGALAVLARDRGDPAVAAAAFRALAGEPSVEVRLLAIDYLAGSGVERETLRQAVDSAAGAMRGALQARLLARTSGGFGAGGQSGAAFERRRQP
ncbi:MAG TPA: hypothetical protein VHQ90_15960 [Thermoanaerobaculia bacterium]|nr:hypothetical protein [Thermoanaerobaculia bacterium]